MKLSPSQEKILVTLLVGIQFCHILDFVIMMPLAPLFMRKLSIGTDQFSQLISAYSFASGVIGILVISFIDKFQRKSLLITMLIGFIFSTYYCGISEDYYHFLIARCLCGFFGGVLTTITFTIISDLIPEERRGKVIGIVMSAFSIASVGGVPLGLFIATKFSWPYAFHTIVAISIIILLLSLIYVPRYPLPEKDKATLIQTFANYFNLLKNKSYAQGIWAIFFLSISAFLIIPFLSPYFVFNCGFEEDHLQYIYLVGGFFTIISSRIIGALTDLKGPKLIYTIVCLLSFLPILIVTNTAPREIYIILLLTTFFMTLVSGRFVPMMTIASLLPSGKDRASYLALVNTIRSFGMALSTFLAGKIVTTNSEGLIQNYSMAGTYCIILTFISLIIVSKIKVKSV
ncbi:MFS transporter [Bacteriovoracaceae bacterium]|nr:MFS transporter [Bacteriovoracaceae bacterium]